MVDRVDDRLPRQRGYDLALVFHLAGVQGAGEHLAQPGPRPRLAYGGSDPSRGQAGHEGLLRLPGQSAADQLPQDPGLLRMRGHPVGQESERAAFPGHPAVRLAGQRL